jgi:hypothetical protein
MYGSAGAGGAGGGPYYHASSSGYPPYSGAAAAYAGPPTTPTPTPPPPQWPVSYQNQKQPGGSAVKRARRGAQAQLRRWWDAALSGGGKRRRQGGGAPSPPPDPNAWLSRLCFFAVAVAYKTPWTAVSSLLGQLADLHGPRVLLGLNLAYFLPSIPVLLSHASSAGGSGSGSGSDGGGNTPTTTTSSSSFESRLGVPTAAALRLFLGLGGLAAVSALLMPALCSASGAGAALLLLLATSALGALYGVAFGASYSLAARRCAPQGATVALSTGFVACGAVVLAADVAIKQGAPDYTRDGLKALFGVVAGTCMVGALASAVLLRRHWDDLEGDGGGAGGAGAEAADAAAPPPSLSSSSPWLSRLRALASSPAAVRSAVRVALLLPPRGGGGGGGTKPRLMVGVPTPMTTGPAAAGPSSSSSASASTFGVSSPSHGVRHRALGAESMALMTSAADGGGKRGAALGGRRSGGGSLGGGGGADASALPVVSASAAAAASGHGNNNNNNNNMHQNQQGGGAGLVARFMKTSVVDPALAATARRAAPAALALALSVGTSMLAFPFFTYTHSGGSLGRSLPQALFYARLAGDVGGRVLTPRLGVAGPRSLVAWSLAKTALLLPLLLALLRPWLAGGDCGLCAAVFGYWALSGAVNTSAYVVAPQLVPRHGRAQAGALMALVFQAACFAGLAAAAVLQAVVPDRGGGGGGGSTTVRNA